MRLFQAPLDTPLDSPFSATLSVHGLHFTVCAPSNSIAEGGIAPIWLVFIGYRASIAEIPLLSGGYRTSTSHALHGPRGETLRKEGGGIAPNWPC